MSDEQVKRYETRFGTIYPSPSQGAYLSQTTMTASSPPYAQRTRRSWEH